MLASLLKCDYDPYHPDSAHALVNSVGSYINSKLDYERKAPEFINEIRRILYFVHEYNSEVAKATQKYPRSRKFDLLLVKYVELEFEALYSNNSSPSRQLESATESRVLRLLHVMLYQAVLSNEPLISGNTDAVLKRAVLQILGEVGSAYLVKNKLVCNIADKLLKVGASNGRSIWEIHKNIATSDYGTDDNDSDFESDVIHASTKRVSEEKNLPPSDCVEVPLTADGVAPIPTIEFTDDDDYFVYLQRRVTGKRKIGTAQNSSNSVSNKDVSSTNSKEKCISAENSDTRTESCAISKSNDTCVIVCSDSEDEVSEALNTSRPVKKNKKRVEDESNKKAKLDQNVGVVTFEILDDDDNGEPNYMVYLQKEVETNKKPKKHKAIEEVIICSDSEDDSVSEVTEKTIENALPAENIDHVVPQTVSKSCNLTYDEGALDDILKLVTADSAEFKEKENHLLHPNLNEVTSAPEVKDAFVLQSEVRVTVSESSNTNFLIDPAVVFEQEQLSQSQLLALKLSKSSKDQQAASTSRDGLDGPNVLGGPVLSEKAGTPEDLDNLQECRINESLLEELLLDDSYLLEGRKEFEELEYFLFNDSTEKQGFYLSNFSFDDDENVLQPETFDADMKSLDSLLDDSQLFTLANLKANGAVSNISGSVVNNRTSKYVQKKKLSENVSYNPLKDSTNKNPSSSVSANPDVKKNTKGFSCRKGKNFRTIFKQSRKSTRR